MKNEPLIDTEQQHLSPTPRAQTSQSNFVHVVIDLVAKIISLFLFFIRIASNLQKNTWSPQLRMFALAVVTVSQKKDKLKKDDMEFYKHLSTKGKSQHLP